MFSSFWFSVFSNVLIINKCCFCNKKFVIKIYYNMYTIICLFYVSLVFPISNTFRLTATLDKYIYHGDCQHALPILRETGLLCSCWGIRLRHPFFISVTLFFDPSSQLTRVGIWSIGSHPICYWQPIRGSDTKSSSQTGIR